ncbi:MAG: hypothetical protein E6I88_13305 [Chloroflexi bacterium]|nr:MAG: hypothetical protein E6I88_13305 [Chloroflexota bacterium]TME47701.1 MAG: hypothetical protein E6I56_03330 [Chloroflexota bacterium]
MGQPGWWRVVQATVAVIGSIAFLSSYVAIPFIVARRRHKERGTPTRSTMKLAFKLTLILNSIWWAIPLVPALFLQKWSAIQLILVVVWAALTIPIGVQLVSRLISPLSDKDIVTFMSFRRDAQRR